MTKISVIIPFYNEPRVHRAIKSVCEALHWGHEYEVIAVDDGSDIPTEHPFNSKVKWVITEHYGRSHARNVGLEECTSEYVAFLDADDEFLPSKLVTQLWFMEQDRQIVMSHTSYYRNYGGWQPIKLIPSGRFNPHKPEELLLYCPIACSTVMVRREAITGLEFYEGISIGEDILMWMMMIEHGKCVGLDIPLSVVNTDGRQQIRDGVTGLLANSCYKPTAQAVAKAAWRKADIWARTQKVAIIP